MNYETKGWLITLIFYFVIELGFVVWAFCAWGWQWWLFTIIYGFFAAMRGSTLVRYQISKEKQ